MGKKRKRPVKDDAIGPRSTASRVVSTSSKHDGIAGHHPHPLISLYYPRVLTLRQYLLQQIPVSSKARRRRIAAVRVDETNQGLLHGDSTTPVHEVANLLDNTLVGVLKEWPSTSSVETRRKLARFTQSLSRSQLDSTDIGAVCAQSEIVDFVISTLFSRSSLSSNPQHLLTHGFQRACGPSSRWRNTAAPACSIPGITALHPNHNVQALKQAPWTDVLTLLGSNGDEIMVRLLLDCGTFTAVNKIEGVYYQISGLPLSTLEPMHQTVSQKNNPDLKTSTVPPPSTRAVVPAPPAAGSITTTTAKNSIPCGGATLQKPNSIVFFRRRMLYARPTFNSKGEVQFGLASRHVLNRYGSSDSVSQTLHVLKYIFPRQFGLHNVFTSVVDRYETSLPFKDYFTREEEIARDMKQRPSNKIPKRLRGGAAELARQLQNRHKHCSYRQLLKYYCPLDSSGPWKLGPVDSQPDGTSRGSSTSELFVTQGPDLLRFSGRGDAASDVQDATADLATTKPKVKVSLTDYATPLSSVSAFCRAVLRKLIPSQFYGMGEDRLANQEVIMRHVDRFVRMRRFESFSIHEVCEGIKITRMPWLVPRTMASQKLSSSPEKLSRTDLQKRTELFHEAIYYIFDSLLVPLIRSNFYVTESQPHRNRLFYFRHDVWQRLTQQPLANLKSTVFEELSMDTARRVLGKRALGYGSLRLLPKSTGIRPILNLRRRVILQKEWNGKPRSFLGASVNSMVTPIYNILNYEKLQKPAQMGSCVFSVGDIQARLKDFKHRLSSNSLGLPSQQRLYFVKLDIQSCFDTIPQRKLVRFIEKLVTEDAYHITRHVEMRPPNKLGRSWPFNPQGPGKPSKKYMGRASSATKPEHLPKAIAGGTSASRRNTVFVDMPTLKQYSVEDLLDLLNEHVSNNLVQFGRRYFRQRNGIPQGSVLSSILCNLFYAEMEREVLGFLQSDDTLLLRLIDDFLLVTTDHAIATRFLHVMLAGQPDYGVSVNPAKSLVNFAATTVEGTHIPRLLDTSLFPYCGNLINTRTLEIFRDHERQLEGGDSAAAAISNSLTVESGRTPGRTFHRKIVSAFILHLHPMYYDDTHNSPAAVWTNLYANFMTAAMKLYRYLRALSGRTHPSADVIVRTIRDLIKVAYRLVQQLRERGPSSTVMHPSQAQYLGATAFRFVLGRKQTRYAEVLRWVDGVVKQARPESARKRMQLAQVVDQGNSMYGGWRF